MAIETINADQQQFAPGLNTKMATNNVNDTIPTNAEITTSFGTPASVGNGFIGVIKDNNADTNGFLVFSNGVTWYWSKFTKAL